MDVNEIKLSENKTAYIAIIGRKAYKINYSFYTIISLLQVNYSLDDACKKVSDLTGFEEVKLKDIFVSFLNLAEHQSSKISYMHFRKILISEDNIRRISKWMNILYNKKIFITLLMTSIIINFLFFFFNGNKIKIDLYFSNVWLYFGLFTSYLVSLFFHEFGHASACSFLGKTSHEIGFGIYFIFPVLYTDVTCVWTLKPSKRILVNFGGIYFQLIFNTCLILAEVVINNILIRTCLLNLSLANITIMITSLIPFFRNDGYWMLSDFIGVDNLLQKSDNCIFNIITHYGNIKFNKKQNICKLLIFGILNWMFRIYIFYFLCKNVCLNFLGIMYNKSVFSNLKSIGIIFISIIGIFWMLSQYIQFFRKRSINSLSNF